MQVGCAEGDDAPTTLANSRGKDSGQFGSKKMWGGLCQDLGQWDALGWPGHYW
jgi:hypothetical protein